MQTLDLDVIHKTEEEQEDQEKENKALIQEDEQDGKENRLNMFLDTLNNSKLIALISS